MADIVEHALALAARGFRVFPLASGSKKPPAGLRWPEVATCIPDDVAKLFREYPGANVGVATGNGLIVLDVDTKNGKQGARTLAYLRDIEEIPETFEVNTPSGGTHLYFRTTERFGNRVDLAEYPGFDLRCEGGYVVGPGSTVDGKPYVSVGDPSNWAPLPQSFAETFATRPERQAYTGVPLVDLDQSHHVDLAKDYLINRAQEAIEGAGGDAETFEVAARCRDYGLSEGVVLDLMLDFWNEQKASPPWAPDELASKVANAFQYATGSWGGQTAEAEFGALDIDVGESPSQKAARLLDRVAAGQRPRHLLSYDEMESLPDDDWLVEGVIPAQGATLLFGKSNTFKSFLAIDLALSVAAGRHWHGRTVKGPAPVIYVATEGAKGVGRQRVPGWFEFHAVAPESRRNIFLRTEAPLIDVAAQVDLLISELRLVQAKFIVLDIFGGTTQGSDTEDTTARAWVAGVQRLIREAGATVLVVAHTGWSDSSRSRGHTHFWGSYDTRLAVEGDKAKRRATMAVERHKDADSAGKWTFNLESCCSTLVPVLDASASPVQHFTGQEREALRVLEEVVAGKGRRVDGEGVPPQPVVTCDEWFDACCAGRVVNASSPKSARSSLNKLRRQLSGKHAIRAHGEYVWPSGFEDDE